MSGETELQCKVSDGTLLRAYLTHLYCVPIFIGAARGNKNEEEQIRRYECREARKRLQQEVDRQQQALESFQEYFNTEHDYAAKDSHDSLSPSPKKKCDSVHPFALRTRNVAGGVNGKTDNFNMSFATLVLTLIGCQTDHNSTSEEELLAVRAQIKVLEEEKTTLKTKVDCQVLSANLLENNNQLTRFYTGFPSSSSFQTFLAYITPKASRLRS